MTRVQIRLLVTILSLGRLSNGLAQIETVSLRAGDTSQLLFIKQSIKPIYVINIDSNGQKVSEGLYSLGVKYKKWSYYFPEMRLLITYVNDSVAIVKQYENEKLSWSGKYLYGKRNGIWYKYIKSKISRFHYKNGKIAWVD